MLKAFKSWNKSEQAVLFWRQPISDASTIIDSDHEQEELPASRLFIQGVDVTNIIFTYKNRAVKVVKSKKDMYGNRIAELAACFNILLLTDYPGKLQVHYLGSSVLETLGECSGFDRSFTMADTVFFNCRQDYI